MDVERNREAMHERRRERGVWGGGYGQGGVKRGGEV